MTTELLFHFEQGQRCCCCTRDKNCTTHPWWQGL